MHAVESTVPDSKIVKAYLFPGAANATFTGAVTPAQQEVIRAKVDEIVKSRARISSHWWNEEEAARFCTSGHNRYRFEEGEVSRAIAIEGIGVCMCAGTHVTEVGEVGKIVLKKFTRKGTSVSFDVPVD
jgi:Ser-tRNA(Ala) deacylase AlaX